jgi:hypothetical protein
VKNIRQAGIDKILHAILLITLIVDIIALLPMGQIAQFRNIQEPSRQLHFSMPIFSCTKCNGKTQSTFMPHINLGVAKTETPSSIEYGEESEYGEERSKRLSETHKETYTLQDE